MLKADCYAPLVVLVICAISMPLFAVSLDSGAYSDDYLVDQWLFDVYEYSFDGTVYRYVHAADANQNRLMIDQWVGDSPPVSTPGYFIYEFTRTDTSKIGVIQFDGVDHGAGDFSWITFGAGADSGTIPMVAGTSYMDGNPGFGDNKIKFSIPKGADTYYLKVEHSGYPGGDGTTVSIDNLFVSADGEELNGYSSQVLTTDANIFSEDFATDAYETENYQIVGSAVRRPPPGSESMMLKEAESSIKYNFKIPGGVQGGKISLEGYDPASGDGSWFFIRVFNKYNEEIYRTNLTNLNGGPVASGSFEIDIATTISALIGTDEFYVDFWTPLGGVSVLNFSVSVDAGDFLAGDLDSDDDVDFADFAVFAENWQAGVAN